MSLSIKCTESNGTVKTVVIPNPKNWLIVISDSHLSIEFTETGTQTRVPLYFTEKLEFEQAVQDINSLLKQVITG